MSSTINTDGMRNYAEVIKNSLKSSDRDLTSLNDDMIDFAMQLSRMGFYRKLNLGGTIVSKMNSFPNKYRKLTEDYLLNVEHLCDNIYKAADNIDKGKDVGVDIFEEAEYFGANQTPLFGSASSNQTPLFGSASSNFVIPFTPDEYKKGNRLQGIQETEEENEPTKVPNSMNMDDILRQMGITMPFLQGPLTLFYNSWDDVLGKGGKKTTPTNITPNNGNGNNTNTNNGNNTNTNNGNGNNTNNGNGTNINTNNGRQVTKEGTTSPIVKTPNNNTGSEQTKSGTSNKLEEKLKEYDKKIAEHDKRIKKLEDEAKKGSLGTGSTTPKNPVPTKKPEEKQQTIPDTKKPTTSPEKEIVLDDLDKIEVIDKETTNNSNAAKDVSGTPSNNTNVEYTTRNYNEHSETVEIPNTKSEDAVSNDSVKIGTSVTESAQDLLGKKDNKTGTTLPKSSSSKTTINASSSSKKGFNPVPLAVGLGAAVAGGIGIKAYKDHKENSNFNDENEDSFTNGNRFWTDEEPNVINSEQNDMSGDILFEDETPQPSYEAVDNGNKELWKVEESIPENTETFDLLGEN